MPIYFFFQGPSLRFIEKKDSFIHSFILPSTPPAKVKESPKENIFFPFTKFFLPIYFFLGLVFVFPWKERSIHSLIATQKRKKEKE
jgi:hypothetical protein